MLNCAAARAIIYVYDRNSEGERPQMDIFHACKRKSVQYLVDILVITVASAVYAAGISLFLDPNQLAPGGISGVAIILNHAIGIMPTGSWIVLLNVPLLIIGVWKFGLKFFFSTIYATVVSSLFINLGDAYLTPLTDDLFLSCIIGGTLVSIGLGIIFRAGATTGGTDIIVKLMRRRFKHISTGNTFMIFDGLVVLASAVVFRNFTICLYAAVAVFVQSTVIDKILYGFDSAKMIYIISEKEGEIASRMLRELNVGVTYMHGEGAYTGKEKNVIMCVLKKQLLPNARDIVREEDPQAFMIIATASDIIGEGYKAHDAVDL